jgi:hypothetical protein
MSNLYASDIFKIYNNFEPSRLKMWEIVRSYDPIQFTKLIYLLENVSYKRGKVNDAFNLNNDDLREFCNYQEEREAPHDCDLKLEINMNATIRLERVRVNNGPILLFNGNPNDETNNYNRHENDIDIGIIMNLIRIGISPEANTSSNNDCDNNETLQNKYNSIYIKLLIHNIGTKNYGELLNSINFQLFTENLQHDRNSSYALKTSTASRYLQFYNMLNCYAFQDFDPRRFRFMVMPRSRRIYERINNQHEYLIQPLYQGFYVVVYGNKNETRFYNRYGELIVGIGYNARMNVSATFIGILLPVDKWGNVRSWRYWYYRHSFIVYIVDVLRYEQIMLIDRPTIERLKYSKMIESEYFIRSIGNDDGTATSWDQIESNYNQNKDVYDPIIGVVLRKPNDLANVTPLEYRFNIKYCFDLRTMNVVDLTNTGLYGIKDLDNSKVHITCEMADYRTNCIAYGHTKTEIYLCEYNRQLHQFIHSATLKRFPHDEGVKFKYKFEKLYVINGKILPFGVMYLRIYYDMNYTIIYYEQKMTDSKFDNPYTNPLLSRR